MKNKYDELLRKGSTNEVYEDIKKEYFTLIANMIDEQLQLDRKRTKRMLRRSFSIFTIDS